MTRPDWIKANPLRLWRAANRVSIAATAAALEVSSVTISNWERGVSQPKYANMNSLGEMIALKPMTLARRWTIWRESCPPIVPLARGRAAEGRRVS